LKKTVFILSCNGRFALEKRPGSGLLAGLWQFPNVEGKLDVEAALNEVVKIGLKPTEIIRQVEKKHVFTHIEWDMCGIYVEVWECGGSFAWMTAAEIDSQAALPTAFRQFWQLQKDSERYDAEK
jgi:A/G-specific adenine glycosylase